MGSNKRDQEIINCNVRNLIDAMQKINLNAVNLDTGNSLEHELKKAEICFKLQELGRSFVTERRLKYSKCKPDILVMDLEEPICYEIMKSEKDISINEKVAKYHGIRIIKVKV